jgi:hypothetical protein
MFSASVEVCGILFGGIPQSNATLVVEKFILYSLSLPLTLILSLTPSLTSQEETERDSIHSLLCLYHLYIVNRRALNCYHRRWRSKFFARTAYTDIAAIHWAVGIGDTFLSADEIRVNHYFNAHINRREFYSIQMLSI